jgi:hypothetical protein
MKYVREILIDVAGLAGTALISYGAWLAYEPAGFIVGGGLLLGGAVRYAATNRSS